MLHEGFQMTLILYIIHLVVLFNLCDIESAQLEFKSL